MKRFQHKENRTYRKNFIIKFRVMNYHSFPCILLKCSDHNDDQLTFLSQITMKDKDVYSKHNFDSGCSKQKFQKDLNCDDFFSNGNEKTKVPIHYREHAKALLERSTQVGMFCVKNNVDELGTFDDNRITYRCKDKQMKLCAETQEQNCFPHLVALSHVIFSRQNSRENFPPFSIHPTPTVSPN